MRKRRWLISLSRWGISPVLEEDKREDILPDSVDYLVANYARPKDNAGASQTASLFDWRVLLAGL